MRILLAAVMAVAVGFMLVSRTSHAGPALMPEERPVDTIIAALTTEKNRRAELATVRFGAEVLGAKTVPVPPGSALSTIGSWADATTLLTDCAPMNADQQKKATALRTEFGDALPAVLTAWTIAGEGNKPEAVKRFTRAIDAYGIKGECPGEHPSSSYRRVSRLSAMISCVRTIDPKYDTSALLKVLEKANACAQNNHAVG